MAPVGPCCAKPVLNIICQPDFYEKWSDHGIQAPHIHQNEGLFLRWTCPRRGVRGVTSTGSERDF